MRSLSTLWKRHGYKVGAGRRLLIGFAALALLAASVWVPAATAEAADAGIPPLVVAQVTPTTFPPTTSPPSPATPAAPATTPTTATTLPSTTTSLDAGTYIDDNGTAVGRDIFRLNGNVAVGPEETVKSVVALNGSVTVRGHVTDTVFTANGDIVVADGGRVDGDAITLNGEVRTIGAGSVGGTTGDRGEWARDVDFSPGVPGFGFGGWFFVTLGALGFGVLLALVSGRSLDSVGREYRAHLGRSALIGFLALIGLPLVFIVLLLSLVGIPLVLLLFPAVFLLGIFGLYALCLVLGRRLLEAFSRPTAGDLWAMVAGVLLIRLILLIPVLGWLLLLIAGVIGFGAVLSRLWEAYQNRRSQRTPAGGLPPTPAAPTPPMTPTGTPGAAAYPVVAPPAPSAAATTQPPAPWTEEEATTPAPAAPPVVPAAPQGPEPAPSVPAPGADEPGAVTAEIPPALPETTTPAPTWPAATEPAPESGHMEQSPGTTTPEASPAGPASPTEHASTEGTEPGPEGPRYHI